MNKLFFCFFWGILLSCDVSSQSLSTIKGTVELIFVKDTIGYNRYWLTHKQLYNDTSSFFLIKDIGDVLEEILLYCSDLEKFQCQHLKNRKRLYDLDQYSNQDTTSEMDYYTHIGGDVYRLGEDQLIIAFDVEIQGFIFESPPCGIFSFESSYGCPVNRARESYPLLIIVDVISANSLEQERMSKKGFKPFELDKFAFGECD